MSKHNEEFFAVVDCMDGRSKAAFARYGEGIGKYPDSVCDGPGAVAHLADSSSPEHEYYINMLRKRLPVSVEKHGAGQVLVGGHPLCAGNPVPDDMHIEQTKKAAETVRNVAHELGYHDLVVIPVWPIDTDGKYWQITLLENVSEQVAA